MSQTSDPQPQPQPRRSSRSSRSSRFNVTTLLAVLLPVACVLALLLVRPTDHPATAHPPTRTSLTTATLVCPEAMSEAPAISLASATEDVRGQVTVGRGKKARAVDVTSGQVTTVKTTDAVGITGEDDIAPGLVGARFGVDETAATSCLPPVSHQWFTAAGAGVGHTSVLELTNPDSGTALADVTVLGGAGVVDAPRLRGVSVPGGSTVRLDLGALIPMRGDLALDVLTVRGRLGASVLDRFDRVGSEPLTQDWLPAQVEPSTTNLMLGLAPGEGGRTLVVANGGDDEVRATVRIVTKDSVFAPKDVPELRVEPHSTRRVTLTSVLGAALSDGAIGLSVTATGPVTSTLRSLAGGDLSHTVGGAPVTSPATMLLPDGVASGRDATKKTLTLAGATRAGTVTVVSRSASGEELDSQSVEIAPDRGAVVDLPAAAVLVTVTPARTAITGSFVVSNRSGAAVLPLVAPVTSGLVPDVRPGLP